MIAKLGIILFACIMLVPPSQCGLFQSDSPTATEQAAQHVEQGDEYFTQGLYDEALNEYDTAIELDPELATAYWGRGRVYHFDKVAYSRAIEDYSRAIELDPEYTDAYFYRGLANEANGVFDRAIPDFSKTIELETELVWAYNLRAWCYVNKAQWELPSQLFLYQLFESDAGLAEAYRGEGWSYVKQMQWDMAAVPYLVKSTDTEITEDIADNSAQRSEPVTPKTGSAHPIKPFVEIEPLSGPVGTKLFIYGWGFRGNEDGVTITWDGEIIMCNIRAETDGGLIVDGSKVPYLNNAHDGDYRETVYVPPTTQGRHVIGVYGSSFTPRGVVNDTEFEVVASVKLSTEPDIQGTKVNVTGAGFASNEIVTISLNNQTSDVTATTDSKGSFNASFITPTKRGIEYTVTASGDKGNSGTASFTINLIKPIPTNQAPDLAEVYCNRGFSHFKKAEWALAIANLGSAYAKNPELNRGSWNKDWALEKQEQWDLAIAEYEKIIAMITGSTASQDKSGANTLEGELALALEDYNKAAEVSDDPAFTQNIKNSIKFVEEWNKLINK